MPARLARHPKAPKLRFHQALKKAADGAEDSAGVDHPVVMRVKLIGANPSPELEGLQALPGKSNYLFGKDPGNWRTKISHYATVQYRDVYPGINLAFYYTPQGQLEYDFLISPGSDPGVIRLAFDGVGEARLDDRGDILLATPESEIRLRRPLLYQETSGVRQEILGGFLLDHEQHVRFEVGAYDPRKQLVIDPVLQYASYLGGGSDDDALGLALDSDGNLYVSGITDSADFPGMKAVQTQFNGGEGDAFVAKLNPAGTEVLYSTYLGGSGLDVAARIAVDSTGNAYITGMTDSDDFPVANAMQGNYGTGEFDSFVAKLNSTGTSLVYSTYLGGRAADIGQDIAVDTDGSAYVTGMTDSANFPTANPLQRNYGGGDSDVFVSKLNPAGSFVYSTYLGGGGTENEDAQGAIAVDAAGNVYVTGSTTSSAFPTANPLQPARGGLADVFVAKLNPMGSGLIYSTYLGGSRADEAEAIAIDAAGSVYVTGYTASTDFPGAGAPPPAPTPINAFAAKLSPDGSALSYARYIATTGEEFGKGIQVDSSGRAWIVGEIDSEDFPTTEDALQSEPTNNFVVRLDPSGAEFEYSSYFPGDIQDIVLDSSGVLHLVGETDDTTPLPVTPRAVQEALSGPTDGFVARMGFPTVFSGGVVNAANFAVGPVAPGEIISIFGAGIGLPQDAIAQLDDSGRVATSLSETTVLFDGVPAPLFFVRVDQINCQVPYSVAGKESTRLQIVHKTAPSSEVEVPVAESAPGIFMHPDGSNRAVVFNTDGSVNSPLNPASPRSIVVLYATGEGQTDPAGVDGKLSEAPFPEPVLPVSLTIGGLEARLLFAGGAPNFAGLLQLNARVPEAEGDQLPVILTIGSSSSQAEATMAVR